MQYQCITPELETVLSETQNLFDFKNDKFTASIINQVNPDVWKINSKNGEREENLLHFFINERFLLSTQGLLTVNHPHLAQLVFEANKAGSTPFMSSLKQEMEEVSCKIWRIMEAAQSKGGKNAQN